MLGFQVEEFLPGLGKELLVELLCSITREVRKRRINAYGWLPDLLIAFLVNFSSLRFCTLVMGWVVGWTTCGKCWIRFGSIGLLPKW